MSLPEMPKKEKIMTPFKFAEKAMSMTEETWARHASPWSVYTRFTCLPLLSLAIWSRAYLGVFSLVPVCLSIFWIWYNPRAFAPPASTDNWASKGTFGERIFLRKGRITIPAHHLRMARILSLLTGSGLPFLVYGLWVNNMWSIVLGNILVILPKIWFVDRMVWVYQDMKDTDPEFIRWLRP